MDQRMKALTNGLGIPSEGGPGSVVRECDDVRGVDADNSLGRGLENDLVLFARRLQLLRSFVYQVLEHPLPSAQGRNAEHVEERKQCNHKDDDHGREPCNLIEMRMLHDL